MLCLKSNYIRPNNKTRGNFAPLLYLLFIIIILTVQFPVSYQTTSHSHTTNECTQHYSCL